MKRTICALLSALFLSVSAIPCAATDSAAAPSPGTDPVVFSDVLPGDWCYDAVMLCRETGILSGTTATTFDPQGTLTIPQMVVILDRVWNLQKHGTAEVPPLPADPPGLCSLLRRRHSGGKLPESPGPWQSRNPTALLV